MRNLRKVVALVLAFAMVLSMGAVSFAADNTEADVLYDLGLFKGYSETEKVLGLEDASNAYQAIVLIGRALGWEVDMDAELAFTDVPDYAAGYVAYAVEMGITNGVSETEFGASVDGKRMATWTLRALGYGLAESWESTDTLAAEAGIEVVTGDITRASVVTVIYDTLAATPVDGDMTVIAKLVAADPTLAAVAQEAGLVEAPAAEFAFESIEAFGLRAFKVAFTSDIDKDTVTVTVKDDTVENVVVDGSMLTVVLDGSVAQSKELTATITATGVDGVKVDKLEQKVVMADTTYPEFVEVTVENAKTFVVKFSEPINPTSYESGTAVFDEVTLDDAKLVGKVTASKDYTTLTYVLNTPVAANTYEFNMEAVADFAGFPAAAASQAVTVIADDAAPVVVETEATTLKTVVLTFDENVDGLGTVTIDGVDYTKATTKADGTFFIDGKKVTVYLTAALDPSDAFVAVKGVYDEATDVVGNKSAKDVEFTFMAKFDDVAPTVTVEVTSDNYLAVTFSEKVTGFDTASVLTVITLKDSKDKDVTEADVLAAVIADETTSKDYSGDASDLVYLVDLDDKTVNATSYSLTFDGTKTGAKVIDGSVIANEVAKAEFAIELNDKQAPSVVDGAKLIKNESLADVADQKEVVRIAFDEAMDADTVSDINNYVYGGAPLKEIDKVEITVADDAKSVDVMIPGIDITGAFALYGLKDVAGNTLVNAGYAVGAPDPFDDVTFTLTANDMIKVSSASHTFVEVDPDDFVFHYEVTTGTFVTVTDFYATNAVINADNDVELTLSSDLKADATTDNSIDIVVSIAGDTTTKTADSFGTKLKETNAVIVDNVAPSVSKIEAGNNKITVTFDEPVDITSPNLAFVLYNVTDKAYVNVTTTANDVTSYDITVVNGKEYTLSVINRGITDNGANTLVINAVEEDTYKPVAP